MSNEQQQQEADKSPAELMREGLESIKQTEEQATAPTEEHIDEGSSEVNELESEARNMGWTPREEYKGDPKKWVDAGEFVRRKPLFDKIDHEVQARKKLEKQLSAVSKYVKQLSDSEYLRKLADLKAQREVALEDADRDTADKVNDQIVQLELAKAQIKEEEANEAESDLETRQEHAKVVANDWVSKNQWFKEDEDLRELADTFAEQFSGNPKNADKTVEDLFAYVDTKMAKYLNKYKATEEVEDVEEKAVPMTTKVVQSKRVTPGAKTTAKRGKATRANLNPTQRSVLDNFILANKIMSEDEYIQSLVDLGEVSV